MESRSTLILEISSDEEDGFRKGSAFDADDCYWLSNLLNEVDGNADDDDSDDVVLVSEVFPKAHKKSRSESLKPVVDVKSDDDDCVILDCDPEKQPLAMVNSRVDDDDDGDLEIVGEKGEVACRDFPHPRHLCAKFLFGSTPHEVHCGQCHCYVCDSLAPCSKWGSGTSSVNHCHASDKEEFWKAERKRVKKADKPTPIGGSCRIESFFSPTQVTCPQPTSLGFNPFTTQMSSNISVSNTTNQVRIYPSGYKHPLGSRNHRGPFPARAVDFVGASQNNRNRGSGNPSLKRCRANQQFTADSVIAHPRLSSLHGIKHRRENFQPGIHSRPYSLQDPTQTYANRRFSSSAIISRPRGESINNNLVLPRAQPNNLARFQPVASYQTDAGNAFVNQLHSIPVSSNLGSHSSQPQQHYNPTSILVDGQNDVQHGNQIQNGTDASSTDFSFLLDSSVENGNVQIHAEDSQYQSTESAETLLFQNEPKSDHHLGSVSEADYTCPITDGYSQFLESREGPDPLDFQFGSWMFENQPLSEVVDSPNWNVFSPEPAFIDTGTLFEF